MEQLTLHLKASLLMQGTYNDVMSFPEGVSYLYELPLSCCPVQEPRNSLQRDLNRGSLEQQRVGVELPLLSYNAWPCRLKYKLHLLGLSWMDDP